MLGRNQMPPQIEQIVNSSVRVQKALRLLSGPELSHAALSDPRWLVWKFGSIVGVLRGVVNCVGYELAMSNTIAPQFVSDYSSRFTATRS